MNIQHINIKKEFHLLQLVIQVRLQSGDHFFFWYCFPCVENNRSHYWAFINIRKA